jgi:hypothetical protein
VACPTEDTVVAVAAEIQDTQTAKEAYELELELIQTKMAHKPMLSEVMLRRVVWAGLMRQMLRAQRLWMLHVLTRAQRTRVNFCPRQWLQCHLGLCKFKFEFESSKSLKQIFWRGPNFAAIEQV